MRRTTVVALVLAAATVGCGDSNPSTPVPDLPTAEAPFGTPGEAVYRVTLENLTTGQPFTPPLLAVHRPPTGLFTVGDPASFELKEIAENGNLGPMMGALDDDRHVLRTALAAEGMPPVLHPGQVRSIEVVAATGATRLSFVSMLICTNDGFTGLDGLRLPRGATGAVTTVTAGAYDAGTEINTEDYADLVPPCQALFEVDSEDDGTGMSDPGLAEGGVIHPHGGIQGVDDLDPEVHDWTDPVVRVTVERIG